MPWNWQLPDWPHFRYDRESIAHHERQFLLKVGSAGAYAKNIKEQDYHQFIVEILSMEGTESARIEGETLDRASLQSSIKQQFGLDKNPKKKKDKESKMAALLCEVYQSFAEPLTHEMLCRWHALLFYDDARLADRGKYRTHREPMQIVSGHYDNQKVVFEAPPSEKILSEMEKFVAWFNATSMEPILGRAAIAHLYFENIHPFEDGNGRIGRVLVEKVLSQGVGRPILIAVSKILEARKKEYYAALESCNRSLDAGQWVEFFADVILQAQDESLSLLYFLIDKSKMLTALAGQMNPRQEKVLLRMFKEGPSGFKGGLSAENYMAITKASKATTTRDLNDLVEKGALVKKGELRHTRYFLATQL
ncbi:MAG: Fic family protein [Chlamydiales bacterium]